MDWVFESTDGRVQEGSGTRAELNAARGKFATLVGADNFTETHVEPPQLSVPQVLSLEPAARDAILTEQGLTLVQPEK